MTRGNVVIRFNDKVIRLGQQRAFEVESDLLFAASCLVTKDESAVQQLQFHLHLPYEPLETALHQRGRNALRKTSASA